MSAFRCELTAPELGKIIGVGRRTIVFWANRERHENPLPRHRRKKGTMYDTDEALEWLTSRGKDEAVARLRGYLVARAQQRDRERFRQQDEREAAAASIAEYGEQVEREAAAANAAALAAIGGTVRLPPPPSSRAARGTGADALPASGNEAPPAPPTSWDIFAVRDSTAQMYNYALRMFVDAPATEKAGHQKNALTIADLLRKLELDCLSVARETRLVVPVADAERLVGRICARVKHDLLNLPHAVAADLAAMTDVAEIARYLETRVVDALRHLSDGIRGLSVDDEPTDAPPAPVPDEPAGAPAGRPTDETSRARDG